MITFTPLAAWVAPYKPLSNVTPFTVKDGATYIEILNDLRKFINGPIVNFINDNFNELGDEFETEVNALIGQVNAALDSQADTINQALADQSASVDADITTLTNLVNTTVTNINDALTAQTVANEAALDAQEVANTAALAAQTAAVNTSITNLTNYVNAQVASIVDESIEAQDPVVAGIVNDDDSATRIALDALYSIGSITDNTMAAVVNDTGSDTREALDGIYRDKETGNSKVYVTDGAGVDTQVDYDTAASANTIAQRDADGKLAVAGPTSGGQATNKTYVDDAITTAIGAIPGGSGDADVAGFINDSGSDTRTALDSVYQPLGPSGVVKFATWLDMKIAESTAILGDICTVDTIKDAYWQFDGTKFNMKGTATFANFAAFNAIGQVVSSGVTFTDAGDVVTIPNHYAKVGDYVTFTGIATTTGIVDDTIYFITSILSVNTVTVSATPGGASLALVNNGTATSVNVFDAQENSFAIADDTEITYKFITGNEYGDGFVLVNFAAWVPWNSENISFTPTFLNGGTTINFGTTGFAHGQYRFKEGEVIVEVYAKYAGTGIVTGTGQLIFAAPYPVAGGKADLMSYFGDGKILDASPANTYYAKLFTNINDSIAYTYGATTQASVTNSVPITPAANDSIQGRITYPARRV